MAHPVVEKSCELLLDLRNLMFLGSLAWSPNRSLVFKKRVDQRIVQEFDTFHVMEAGRDSGSENITQSQPSSGAEVDSPIYTELQTMIGINR